MKFVILRGSVQLDNIYQGQCDDIYQGHQSLMTFISGSVQLDDIFQGQSLD